jgi:hypothetical protein
MLTHTFCHLTRIGERFETLLWSHGVHTWADACAAPAMLVSRLRSEQFVQELDASRRALSEQNPRFFSDSLPSHLHWRFYPDFMHVTAFLDIETSGLSEYHDHPTTVTLFDGQTIKYYIYGLNLDRLPDDLSAYKVLVTYNGRRFDIPCLERHFKLHLPHAQIDLRYVLQRLGYRGGLKACERALGIQRGDLDGVDGYMAVLLWREYARSANPAALETLLAYNIADTVNLLPLMILAYNLHVQRTPFAAIRALPMRTLPEIPFQPHSETLSRLRWMCDRYGDSRSTPPAAPQWTEPVL